MIDFAALQSEIAKPEYAGMDDAAIADALNAKTITERTSRMVTKTTVYAAIGFNNGLVLLAALKQQAASSDFATALKASEILDLMRPEGGGLDISLNDAQAVIDQLVAGGALSDADGATLKGLGETTVQFSETIGGTVSPADITNARAM